MRVNKSISMDLDLVNAILDEANEMGRDFSSAICVLVRIGIDGRRISRERDQKLSPDELKRV